MSTPLWSPALLCACICWVCLVLKVINYPSPEQTVSDMKLGTEREGRAAEHGRAQPAAGWIFPMLAVTSSCEAVVEIAAIFIWKYFRVVIHMTSTNFLKLVAKLKNTWEQNRAEHFPLWVAGAEVGRLCRRVHPWESWSAEGKTTVTWEERLREPQSCLPGRGAFPSPALPCSAGGLGGTWPPSAVSLRHSWPWVGAVGSPRLSSGYPFLLDLVLGRPVWPQPLGHLLS